MSITLCVTELYLAVNVKEKECHMLPMTREYFVAKLDVCIFIDVEELTRKTGNFKGFPVFVKMLESAIVKVRHE